MVLVSLEKLAYESIFINEDKETKWNNDRWIKQSHSIWDLVFQWLESLIINYFYSVLAINQTVWAAI